MLCSTLLVGHLLDQQYESITVIVVSYNSEATIGRTLNHLRSAHESGMVVCILVDNASNDNTVDLVVDNYPWVRVIRSETNLGFGRGCNLGFREATTKYVMFLNPDAYIREDALMTLSCFLEKHSEADIVSPATLLGSGAFQHAGSLLTPKSLVAQSLRLTKPQDRDTRISFGGPTIEVEWICGAVMMIRRDLFERLGGFDPRFFLYFEETDLLLRAHRIGARVFVVGDAHAYHEGGVSARMGDRLLVAGCIAEHYFPSRYYYLVKNFGWFRATSAELLVAFAEVVRTLRGIMPSGDKQVLPSLFRRPFLKLPRRIND